MTGTGKADVFSDPVVEYVIDGSDTYELRFDTLDTNCVYGSASLEKLAKTYAGFAKDDSISEAAKCKMKDVFCDPNQTANVHLVHVQRHLVPRQALHQTADLVQASGLLALGPGAAHRRAGSAPGPRRDQIWAWFKSR